MMEQLKTTPSQTVGPFFAYSLTAEQYGYGYNSIVNDVLTGDGIEGRMICIKGQVFDGAGSAITDAMIELWHADNFGQYRETCINGKNDGFMGFGRVGTGTNSNGEFSFTTIKPKFSDNRAPHINVILFMRGSLHGLYTRIYFSDDEKANTDDELLNNVPAERRHTLIAQKNKSDGIATYLFDIHMQGENETAFFEL
ncbi:MAG TPA: protocatechuate 3,4-dioxygenase subunit alpha [Mucilaginibacter sp.]|jgi:protocatechuate 3,4-dioxygenase alpha subunit